MNRTRTAEPKKMEILERWVWLPMAVLCIAKEILIPRCAVRPERRKSNLLTYSAHRRESTVMGSTRYGDGSD